MGKILVVGSIAIDSVITPFGERSEQLGGSASYFSFAASLFSDIDLIGIIGEDFPDEFLQHFKARKINLEGLEVKKGGKTFRWEGKYLDDMNQRETLFLGLNAFAEFKPQLSSGLKNPDILFLANIDPKLQSDVIDQLESSKFIACDTMDHWITSSRDELVAFMPKINLLVLNDSEAMQLSGSSNLLGAGEALLAMGPEAVIIKKGEHGALLIHRDGVFNSPAYPLREVKDPTGAGDSFAGGCMGYLAQCGDFDFESLKQAVVYGTVCGSFCCESFGPDNLLNIGADEVQARIQDFRKITQF